jgi:hypothetical protein
MVAGRKLSHVGRIVYGGCELKRNGRAELNKPVVCPNCNNPDGEVLLIDCTLSGEERKRQRFCYACRPEARHPYANCLPQIIAILDIPESEKQAAFRARRFAPDRSATYSIEERLIDLAGSIVGPIK